MFEDIMELLEYSQRNKVFDVIQNPKVSDKWCADLIDVIMPISVFVKWHAQILYRFYLIVSHYICLDTGKIYRNRFVFTRGQFWPPGIVVACVCPCGRQSPACPRDNISPYQPRITKFEPDVENTLVKIPIVLRDDWLSRSNLTLKSKFALFWACPHDHSPPVEVRIFKFWPKMHPSTVKISNNFGIDWSWSSISFSILKPVFLPNLYALFF